MSETQYVLGLLVSGLATLISLWTRVAIAQLKNFMLERFATKHEVEKLEERLMDQRSLDRLKHSASAKAAAAGEEQ